MASKMRDLFYLAGLAIFQIKTFCSINENASRVNKRLDNGGMTNSSFILTVFNRI
jgi:hypothetical protein